MTKINFLVISRAQAEHEYVQGTIVQPHILISINGTTSGDSTPANIPDNKNRVDMLQLQFDDIDIRHTNVVNEEYPSMIFFSEEHARNILNFVEKNIKDINTIVVHCYAGISRSRGVACALSKILNNEDDVLFKAGCPNMLCYRTVLDKYFLTIDNYHLLWENIYEVRESNLEPV